MENKQKAYDLINFIINYMKDNNIKNSRLSEISGISEGQLSNYFNFKRVPTLSVFLKILDALGLKFKIEI